ncbi:MAG TPA: cysteine--tRNA ligase [Anaerohalosphaeraceae bacterium]|nr:cysteine--tRNA ligase [Anaerohalosphaeraceae bacterium]HOL88793.1 cysteine--tRNA ligase [Anaerohalosphaeraceae bacterium]HPP55978.1 cysteine--tRNA ligase [Anaerohalosphaeraceae bacterium]
MALRLYNTLGRKIEEFKPLREGQVGIYVCGPTVYGHAHLGHAKSYVSFDVLIRYLRFLGYAVTHVQNITDVGHLTDDADAGEDKIGRQAQRERKHPMAIAEFYTRSFFEDMDALNCLRPDISPRATGHIPEQIELVQTLLEKGYAYEVNGSVYFDVSRWPSYGRLSGRNVEEMLAGARVEVNPEKRHPADFALWKRAEPGHIMQWNSPWGRGYPGWHLECSVMSMKYLGPTIDIHGGGIENQFPHHECEIAQSEAANGQPFVRYWLHHNMVTVDGQKMGKSLNNFITLKQIFKEGHPRLSRTYPPMAVRCLILQSHYRSPIDFSDAALSAALSGYEKITDAVLTVRKQSAKAPAGPADADLLEQIRRLEKKFFEAMDDDLNTSIALSVLFELVRAVNALAEKTNVSAASWQALGDAFVRLGEQILGLRFEESVSGGGTDEELLDFLIGQLIAQRAQARARKDFAESDRIRDQLARFGIILEDKPGGITTWRRQ